MWWAAPAVPGRRRWPARSGRWPPARGPTLVVDLDPLGPGLRPGARPRRRARRAVGLARHGVGPAERAVAARGGAAPRRPRACWRGPPRPVRARRRRGPRGAVGGAARSRHRGASTCPRSGDLVVETVARVRAGRAGRPCRRSPGSPPRPGGWPRCPTRAGSGCVVRGRGADPRRVAGARRCPGARDHGRPARAGRGARPGAGPGPVAARTARRRRARELPRRPRPRSAARTHERRRGRARGRRPGPRSGWPTGPATCPRTGSPRRCGRPVARSATPPCSPSTKPLRRDVLGAGPLEPLLRLPGVTDVLVNGPDQVYVDRGDGLEATAVRFADDESVRRLAQRLAAHGRSTARRRARRSPTCGCPTAAAATRCWRRCPGPARRSRCGSRRRAPSPSTSWSPPAP